MLPLMMVKAMTIASQKGHSRLAQFLDKVWCH